LFDRDKVEKIVTNLVSNALKFTAEGGSVKVTLKYSQDEGLKPGTHAVLLVRDTGPGIPAEQQEKIFDRFYQVQNSDSRTYEGSGIGLALVKELVELYGGEIFVESKPGSGSTFTVKLPASREQFREAEIFIPTEKQTEPGLPDDPDGPGYKTGEPLLSQDLINKGKKDRPVILVVEDNPDLRDYIMQNLLGDYQILQAENGKTGLEKTVESIPDLVITDLMMPEMDGMEMCHRLKSDYRTNHIPLVMLTAKADRESKLESLQTGADDFILKPFDAEELKARVKNLIDQRIKLRERYRKELIADLGSREIPPPEDEFMVRVMNCITKHLSESEFNVEQMGKELALSRTQLYRKILAITDHTPGELIRNNRLKMAARMFQEGHRNVTSVMYSVGFDTSVNFAHHFRQMFGVNPSEYIRQNSPSKE
jgi:DNA-binding response OmpR family regulator